MDMLIIALFVIIAFLTVLCYLLRSWYSQLSEQYQALLKQKQSENVKHGFAWEQFVPFASNFPFNREQFKFLGKPVDGVVFGEDKITFVEIKTGQSHLNDAQKQVRKLVEDKKVEWRELRY
jgi:predicted Holliday junction resolvase-like endonuclease